MAQPRLPGQPDILAAGRLLLTSERPVLVRTEGGDLGLRGPVLICWNGSPAARRALEDAVPLIPAPGLATLLVVDGAADRRGARDAAAVLRAAGFDVAVRSVASGAASVAETIAAEAERLDAGLIVLGGYSRSPTLERIFGGVTRSFLVAAPRPLLLSHVPRPWRTASPPVRRSLSPTTPPPPCAELSPAEAALSQDS